MRLDDDVLAALIASVREATSEGEGEGAGEELDPRDLDALATIDRAEVEMSERRHGS